MFLLGYWCARPASICLCGVYIAWLVSAHGSSPQPGPHIRPVRCILVYGYLRYERCPAIRQAQAICGAY